MTGFFKEELNKIKAMVFDVDGVLSGQILLHPNGDLLRHTNAKDGLALHKAVQSGLIVAIITGGKFDVVKQRFNNIGITDVYLNSHNKIIDFKHFIKKHNLKFEDILYMGDDIPDYAPMKKAGLACAPADAAPEIKAVSDYISDKNGGDGCVRDVVEQVLKAQGKWFVLE